MFKSKKLNGSSSGAQTLTAGEGISIRANEIHIDDTVVATDTQLTSTTSGLINQSQLTSATSSLVTQDTLTTATSVLATTTQLNTATAALASLAGTNTFLGQCLFELMAVFKSLLIVYPEADVTQPGDGGGIYLFREMKSLRSFYTTPTWVNVELVHAHFTAGTYYATPQYTKFQYGAASMVKLRGEMQERDDYLNSSETRRLFTLPLGYRPANRHLFVCAGGNGRIAATVLVNHNGDVLYLAQSSVVEHDSVNTLWLDSISFFTN